jgi:hypothetical protein
VFDEGVGGKEFGRLARETKERAGEPVDYNSILLWKLASALAARGGSNSRTQELADLVVLLTPYMDAAWDQDVKAITIWEKRRFRFV